MKQEKNSMINLNYNSYFENDVLYHGWNQGFFSNTSTCLWNLCQLKDYYGIEPKRIDFSHAFAEYKTNNLDIYSDLFRRENVSTAYSKSKILDHHTVYREEDLAPLLYFVKRYFMPANPIMELQRKLRVKYDIDVQNTLVVCIRGTDKLQEVRSAAPKAYFLKCEELLKRNPGFRVWVQTDQKQYLDYFLGKYPDRAFFISEIPVSTENKAIHRGASIGVDRFEFGQLFLAATHLSAQCKLIVTHTGNVGYWQALYRGHLNDFYQDITHFCNLSKIQSLFYRRLSYGQRVRISRLWWGRAILRTGKYTFSEGGING